MPTKHKKRGIKTNVTKKVYGHDKIEPYAIHKSTLISFDPVRSCKQFIEMFGNAVSDIHSPPDPALKKRGIKWIRFKTHGKAEFHFVPPYTLQDDKKLRAMVKEQEHISPLESQFFENHVGMYVPSLTNIVINCLKKKVKCHLNKRADGMYQFYVDIDGCLDYLDLDSLNFNLNKVLNIDPNFKVHSFKENTKKQKKLQKKFIKSRKNKHSEKIKLYSDPNHKNFPRSIKFNKDGTVNVTGKDTKNGKTWRINGLMERNNNIILDFSSKGGPKDIKGKVTDKHIKFADGNVWTSIYNIL